MLLQIILTQLSLLWLSDSGRLYGWATVVLLGRLLLRLQRKGRNRGWFLPSRPDLIQMECAGQHLWIGFFFCDHLVVKAPSESLIQLLFVNCFFTQVLTRFFLDAWSGLMGGRLETADAVLRWPSRTANAASASKSARAAWVFDSAVNITFSAVVASTNVVGSWIPWKSRVASAALP